MTRWLVGIAINQRFINRVRREHSLKAANNFSVVPLAPPSSVALDKRGVLSRDFLERCAKLIESMADSTAEYPSPAQDHERPMDHFYGFRHFASNVRRTPD